jgi:hypothetical protein
MIFRNRRTRPFHWLGVGTERGRTIGRVRLGQHAGSGCLLDGSIIGEHYVGVPLFFTARQVIPGEYRTLPKDLTVTFDALTDDPQGGTTKVERLLAMSPVQHLNYSVALLDRWPGRISPVNLCPRDPVAGDLIFVLGYPGGRGLEVSLDDNEVLVPSAAETREALVNPADVVFYRAPTEPGSSGSAVFNENWELTAIHMGSDRRAEANYGARIHAVVEDAKRRLGDVVLEDELIARVKADRTVQREYFSVFISYSHADSVFADRLFNSLRSEGVRAWYDKQNILPGYDIYEEITRGVHEQDKVLFCFSEAADRSGWVDAEIDRALQKEREMFRTVRAGLQPRQSRSKPLIPLDLDGQLIEGRWKSGKAPDLMSRGIADFRNWQDQSTFNRSFLQLLSALRPDPDARDGSS